MNVAAAVTEQNLRFLSSLPADVTTEYEAFAEQCFATYWTRLLRDMSSEPAFSSGKLLPWRCGRTRP